ncbi:hypothetical protein [Halobellus sp. GM3]|uniref:hypothetical protein n=1 Tax=Halobellus sp. GM3 TaxID=3458410 RepID=UPI00403DFBF9
MTRRVPEFAVLIGVFLGVSVVVTGITLGWSLYDTVVVAALVSYPFVGFGVVRDDDPAATIRPRWVLAAGGTVAGLGALSVLLDRPALAPETPLVAWLVGLVLFAPPAAYAVRYGADVNPLSPETTVLVGAAVGLALAVAGLLVDSPLTGVAAGAVSGLGAALYGTARGVDPDARTKRLAASGGGLIGLGIVAIGVVRGGALGEWLLVGAAAALVPSLYAALTAESGRKRASRRGGN